MPYSQIDYVYADEMPKECECGAKIVKSPRHSDWCPIYEPWEK